MTLTNSKTKVPQMSGAGPTPERIGSSSRSRGLVFGSRVARMIVYGLVITVLSHTAPASTVSRSVGPPPQTEDIEIPDGTELEVVTTEDISSKTAREGDPVTFKLVADVFIDNYLVLAKGTLVRGTVSMSEQSGNLGKSGKLGVRIESTTAVDGQRLKVRASQAKAGDDKTGTAMALVAIFGVFGFLKKGKDATIKKGTRTKVFTDELKRVRIKGGLV